MKTTKSPRPVRSGVEDALDLLLLRAWGMFNRCEGTGVLPEDSRREVVEALRAAHEALDAATGTRPSFPYGRFPALRARRARLPSRGCEDIAS